MKPTAGRAAGSCLPIKMRCKNSRSSAPPWTQNSDAQGGGIVNTTLKAGTNKFHGTLFNYYVNSVFNANTFTNNLAGKPKGLQITNQYGGTFGGPIFKNKAFFFASF